MVNLLSINPPCADFFAEGFEDLSTVVLTVDLLMDIKGLITINIIMNQSVVGMCRLVSKHCSLARPKALNKPATW